MIEQNTRGSPTLYTFKRKLNAQHQQASPLQLNLIQTSRLGKILLANLRLECSSLNHHLHRENFVESLIYSCGMPEMSFHFLLACAKYSNARQRYFSGLELPLTVKTRLYGKPEENLAVNNNIFRRVYSCTSCLQNGFLGGIFCFIQQRDYFKRVKLSTDMNTAGRSAV